MFLQKRLLKFFIKAKITFYSFNNQRHFFDLSFKDDIVIWTIFTTFYISEPFIPQEANFIISKIEARKRKIYSILIAVEFISFSSSPRPISTYSEIIENIDFNSLDNGQAIIKIKITSIHKLNANVSPKSCFFDSFLNEKIARTIKNTKENSIKSLIKGKIPDWKIRTKPKYKPDNVYKKFPAFAAFSKGIGWINEILRMFIINIR